MYLNYDELIENIFKYCKEALDKNYTEFIVQYDLTRMLDVYFSHVCDRCDYKEEVEDKDYD